MNRLAAEVERLGREDRTADWFGVLLGTMPSERHEGLPVTQVVEYRLMRAWSDPSVRQRVTAADLPGADRGLVVVGCVSIPSNASLQTGLSEEDVSWTSKCFTHPRQVVLLVEKRLGACPLATFLVRESVGFLPFVLLEFPLNEQELQPAPAAPPRPQQQQQQQQQQQRRPQGQKSAALLPGWRSQRALAAYATGVIGLGLLGWAVVKRGHTPEEAGAVASGGLTDRAAGASPLHLHVEAAGQGLEVSWRLPAAADDLLGGLLIVTENRRPLGHFALSPDQLQMGRIFFRPPADQLQLQLEVQTRTQGTVKEAILAFLPGAAPHTEQRPATGRPPETRATVAVPAAAPPAWLTKPIPVQPESTRPASSVERSSAPPPTQPVDAQPLTASPVVSAYSPPPPPPNMKPDSVTPSNAPAVAIPPVIQERAAANEVSLPPASTAPAPVPSAPVKPVITAANIAPAAAAKTAAPPRVLSTLERYQPPSPLHSERPRLERKLWSKIDREVTVEANLHINKSGKVVHVEMTPLNNDSFGWELNTMVKESVKQWQFKPARIGDQAVDADHTIKFVFHPAPR